MKRECVSFLDADEKEEEEEEEEEDLMEVETLFIVGKDDHKVSSWTRNVLAYVQKANTYCK